MPLDVETIIPEDDSVRTQMRIAQRIDYAIAFDIEKLQAKEQSGRLKTTLFYPDSA